MVLFFWVFGAQYLANIPSSSTVCQTTTTSLYALCFHGHCWDFKFNFVFIFGADISHRQGICQARPCTGNLHNNIVRGGFIYSLVKFALHVLTISESKWYAFCWISFEHSHIWYLMSVRKKILAFLQFRMSVSEEYHLDGVERKLQINEDQISASWRRNTWEWVNLVLC